MLTYRRKPIYAYVNGFQLLDQDRGVDPVRVTIDIGYNGVLSLNPDYVGKSV
jgi:hypothetical protein